MDTEYIYFSQKILYTRTVAGGGGSIYIQGGPTLGGPTPKYFNPTQNPGPGRARDSCLKPNKKSPLRGLESLGTCYYFLFFYWPRPLRGLGPELVNPNLWQLLKKRHSMPG